MAGSFHAIGLVFSLQYNLHDGLKQQVEQWWQSLYYHMEMQFLMITMMMVRIKIIFRSKLVRKIHGNHVLGHRDYMIHDRTLMGFPEKCLRHADDHPFSTFLTTKSIPYRVRVINTICLLVTFLDYEHTGTSSYIYIYIYNVRILSTVLVLVA